MVSVIYEIRFQRYVAVKKHMLFMNRISFFFFFIDFCASENLAKHRRQRLDALGTDKRRERALFRQAEQDDLL